MWQFLNKTNFCCELCRVTKSNGEKLVWWSLEIKSNLSVNANYFKAGKAREWGAVTPLLCLATQAGKMELLLANEKRNFFVSSESWNIVNTGKIYHLLNFFLFSTPFFLFFFVWFRWISSTTLAPQPPTSRTTFSHLPYFCSPLLPNFRPFFVLLPSSVW